MSRTQGKIDRTIKDRPIATIKAYANNAKQHGPAQIKALARSITSFGFTSPVLLDETGELIAGHGRLEAAKLLGLQTVPSITIKGLSAKAKHLLRLADNRIAETNVSWSTELLRIEFDLIQTMEGDLDLDLSGFDTRELSLSFDTAASKAKPDEPPVPDVGEVAITRLGDVWVIGEHRLVCGDATESGAYLALLGREKADQVFSDPPYNVPIQGHVTGKGRAKHREFVAASGEMTTAEFRRFLTASLTQMARFSRSGSLHYIWIDWAHIADLLAAGEIAYDELKNLCVWTKSNAGMGSLYRSQHELVAVFKKGRAAHTNNVELGKHGRNRSNVWAYAGMNSFSAERDAALAIHPTVKPLALVRDAIIDASDREDVVLDPFGGSGTTLLAADAVRRRARLIELDPLYCDVIVRRAQQALGIRAVLQDSGMTFDEAAGREVVHG
jgi:DNA modification methylase